MGAGASVDTIVSTFIDERIHNVCHYSASNSITEISSNTASIGAEKLRPTLRNRFSSNGPPKSLKSSRSIRSMALMNYSKHENSYIQPREVINATMTRTSSRRNSNSKSDANISLSKRCSSTDKGEEHIQQKNSHTLLNEAIAASSKPGDGFRKKINLKINIQDDIDWIQVSDDEGGEEEQQTETPRGAKVPVREKLSLCDTAQSYLFTQSGTILLDGLVGIGKDGLDDSLARTSSARAFKLPVDKRLVLLCRLGHGASSVVYKALDLVKMKLVAVKMISVFERGKRRQMARELSALLQVLRQKKLELKSLNALDILRNPKPPTGVEATTPKNGQTVHRPSAHRKKSTDESNEFVAARIAIANSLLSGVAMSPRAPIDETQTEEQDNLSMCCQPPVQIADNEANPKITTNNTNGNDVYSYYLRSAHEYIVEFYDAFSNIDDGGVALMMEYMDGGSLQEIVDAGGCDDEEVLANISIQALIGLAFLHNCSQIHRDLKPGNFLISHSGEVKVADLGILRQLDGGDENAAAVMTPMIVHTPSVNNRGVTVNSTSIVGNNSNSNSDDRSHVIPLNPIAEVDQVSESSSSRSPHTIPHTRTFVGTATYMSPERIDGREYSFPADVWAFGLSIMTLALGKMPIDTAGGYWSILQSIRDDAPPTLPDDGRFSAEFRDFLSCCLRPNPEDRLSCNQLLTHPFLQKASPEEIDHTDSIERGSLELRSILNALYTHLDGIKGLPAGEMPHPFFSGLYSPDTSISLFMAAFLFGRSDITSIDQLKNDDYRFINEAYTNGGSKAAMVLDSSRINSPATTATATSTPFSQQDAENSDSNSCGDTTRVADQEKNPYASSTRLGELARQLYLPLSLVVTETLQICREFRVKEVEGSSPTLLTAHTPKAYHHKR